MTPDVSFPDGKIILGLESSCDETAAAVVVGGRDVRSNVIATQDDLHAAYAGVVPEIASRAHLERLLPVVEQSLEESGTRLGELDAIAVGHRPGLIGSLLVGVSAAKALAWSLGVPVIGVDHVHAHLYGGLLAEGDDAPPTPEMPALGLVVSGGHTNLYRVTDPLGIELLGRTIDDAIGEAFDKAATILDLGYPGGPRIDAIAAGGNDRAYDLPIARLDRDSLDFSFSGLKTALLYAVRGRPAAGQRAVARGPLNLDERQKADFAASFQRSAVAAVMLKLERCRERHPDARSLLVGGGVCANRRLRAELAEWCASKALDLRIPPPRLCLDNAAMIAGLAAWRLRAGDVDDLSLAAAARSAPPARRTG